MLALDSPRWRDLRQAYGNAKETPKLINDLIANKSRWKDAWGSLCHQNSIYSATYAAVPHLVSLTDSADLEFKIQTLILCGTIQSKGNLVGGTVPPDLIEPFDSAMEVMQQKSLPIIREAIAQNLHSGFPSLVQAAYALRYGASPECPECDAEYDFDSEENNDINLENFEKLILNQEGSLTCPDCDHSFSC
ncbi:MAG: CpXC domain-containing protein [Candidatus Obscuribacterales bacterium]|nr:CpXC domain-containing protein [Candidatus Obscuribacterales bacterium]